jgi:hypothetical protein
MSNLIYGSGTAEFTIAASDKLAVYSRAPVKVYQKVKLTNHPDQYSLLKEVQADTEYLSSAFTAATEIRIEAGAAQALYQAGTAPVITERRGQRGQGAPGVLNATGTLTAAMIAAGIVTSTTAAGVTATLDTGAVMDAALEMEIGDSFDWSAIATGANAFTVTAAASGHTVVGAGAVATVTSGLFRTRKTATATYITYRIG